MIKLFIFIVYVFVTSFCLKSFASTSPQSPEEVLDNLKHEDPAIRREFMQACQRVITDVIVNGWVDLGGLPIVSLYQLTTSHPPEGFMRISVAPYQGVSIHRSMALGESASCNAYSNGQPDPWIMLNKPIHQYSVEDLERVCIHEVLCAAGFDDSTHAAGTRLRLMAKFTSKNAPIADFKLERAPNSVQHEKVVCNQRGGLTCRGGTRVGGAGDLRTMQFKQNLYEYIMTGIYNPQFWIDNSLNIGPYLPGGVVYFPQFSWALKVLNCPIDIIDSFSEYVAVMNSLGANIQFEQKEALQAEIGLISYYDRIFSRYGLLMSNALWDNIKSEPRLYMYMAQLIGQLPGNQSCQAPHP